MTDFTHVERPSFCCELWVRSCLTLDAVMCVEERRGLAALAVDDFDHDILYTYLHLHIYAFCTSYIHMHMHTCMGSNMRKQVVLLVAVRPNRDNTFRDNRTSTTSVEYECSNSTNCCSWSRESHARAHRSTALGSYREPARAHTLPSRFLPGTVLSLPHQKAWFLRQPSCWMLAKVPGHVPR